LQATGKYNFIEQSVVLCFWDYDFDWSLLSLTGVYVYDEMKIKSTEFVEITGRDFVYNITPTGVKAKVFKLNISKIDRHILMKKFSVKLNYIVYDDNEEEMHSTTFSFEVC
jgi:hypothetical protein